MTSLADLRILDLSDGVAGAYCTRLFAGFGADVIVVEPPGSGHPLRRHGSFPDDRPHRETGALWLYLGASKRSITLDVGVATGRGLFRRLAEEANVIVESFRPGRLASLGLGFPDLRAIKRRLVLVSITPFGQTGPQAAWRATDLTSFASGGQMSLIGEPEREPLLAGGYQAEYQAGLQAFAATATAAQNADALEVAQHVDLSAQEGMASTLGPYLPWRAHYGQDTSQGQGAVEAAHTIGQVMATEPPGTRDYFREIEHPVAGRLTHPGPPCLLSEIEWQAGRAPTLGEHNDDVYCGELGLSRQELARLRAAGVV
jgi:crotonobetainyl-CoA:carnitine CoA-transferase CaiB-like acyl-CoA transferase